MRIREGEYSLNLHLVSDLAGDTFRFLQIRCREVGNQNLEFRDITVNSSLHLLPLSEKVNDLKSEGAHKLRIHSSTST
jgi:hypothetical protein